MEKPCKIYAEVIEDMALEQFNSAMELDRTTRGALMPDAHTGYTLPIGAAVETDGIVFPSWVGFDLGCGMSSLPTAFTKAAVEKHGKEIFKRIYKSVPTGVGVANQRNQSWSQYDTLDRSDVAQGIFDKCSGFKQLGSLGSGNHFIEIGYDEDDMVWITIHSGSRGVGWKTAEYYMKLAAGQDPYEQGKAKEGHYGFEIDSKNGKNYIKDLNFCLQFALENRKIMIQKVEKVLSDVLGQEDKGVWSHFINRNHNHAEDPKGDGRWVHRKGATQAESGMKGVIPGNMRDGCFIVEGKGNEESLCSSSHGAGRVLSRTKAKKTLDMDTFKSDMDGIIAKVEKSTLDESSGAYKDIFEVMRLQQDLVDVLAYVKPIINIKA